MELAAVFNPTSATSGQFTASTLQVGSTVVVINKSYVDIILTFASGDRRLVIANDRRAFVFSDASATGSPIVKWAQENIDYPQTVNQLENVVYVEVYSASEKVVETYPALIQRETLPSLVPYNRGHSSKTLFVNPTSATKLVIWPSSYVGLAVAPQSIGGLGYDHFYLYQNLTAPSMFDIPGLWPSTGKTGANATPFGTTANTKYVPGPFSLSGLEPIDTGNSIANEAFNAPFLTQWQTITSWIFDVWINMGSFAAGGSGLPSGLFTDNSSIATNTGMNWFVDNNGFITAQIGYSGGRVILTSGTPISLSEWHYIAVTNSGNGSAGNINLWIDGQIVATATSSGTGVLGTLGNSQLFQGPNFTGYYGSFANFGIRFNYPIAGGSSSQSTIPARYEHGLQSLNVDYQNAWITGFEVECFSATGIAGNTASILLDGIFNSSGLLFASTPVLIDPLHTYPLFPNEIQYNFGPLAAASVNRVQTYPPIPFTHFNTSFLSMTFGVSSGAVFPFFSITVHGYNFLGVS